VGQSGMVSAELDKLTMPDDPYAVVVTDAHGVRAHRGAWQEIFPWASVTKPLAAYATLIAVERHLLDLDAPAGPPGATVRHLLAHTAGYNFSSPEVLAQPGRTRIYSNPGFDVLGEVLAEATGMGVGEWIEQVVLVPLGMSTVIADGSPAHSATGTAEDLATFGRELLVPTLLSAELHAEATRVAFPGLRGTLPGFGRQQHNDWGLGFEIKTDKTPHWTGNRNSPETFGHFGQSGSFLWVDPVAGLATAYLGARPFEAWAVELWPQVSDAVLADHAP